MFTDKQKNKFIGYLEKYIDKNNIKIIRCIHRKYNKIERYLASIYINLNEEIEILLNEGFKFSYKARGKRRIIILTIEDLYFFGQSEELPEKTKDFIKAIIEYFEGE